MKTDTFGDYLITAEIIIIGVAETVHLAGVFLRRPFSQCAGLFGILLGLACVTGTCFFLLRNHFKARGKSALEKSAGEKTDSDISTPGKAAFEKSVPGKSVWKESAGENILCVLFAVLFVSQVIFIIRGDSIYCQGDMTVEAVQSFLASDRLYQVNPMTGMPYTGGIPSRLKILCLPTLYGSLCKITGLSPRAIVWVIAPIATLCSCYAAFSVLSRCLFPEDGGVSGSVRRKCFMVVTALLLWTGIYRYGMDGFNILCAGWRGVAIRNGVLVPWLFSLCLRRKWLSAVLCVLAEACITWTLYGCGACLAITAGMAVAQFCYRRWSEGRRSAC